MKHKILLTRIFGIIAMAVIMVFGFTACGGDDGGGGGGGGGPTITISNASGLIGTWVGDTTNGTLVFTANDITSPDTTNTKAKKFVNSVIKASGVTSVTTDKLTASNQEVIQITTNTGGSNINYTRISHTNNGVRYKTELKIGFVDYDFVGEIID